MVEMITIGVLLTIGLVYKASMWIAAKAIEADERADEDFGYYGRYSRLDSWG